MNAGRLVLGFRVLNESRLECMLMFGSLLDEALGSGTDRQEKHPCLLVSASNFTFFLVLLLCLLTQLTSLLRNSFHLKHWRLTNDSSPGLPGCR